MISARFVWLFQSNELLSNIQCGFRHGSSTLDHLVRFETFIRNAFAKKEHAVSIFFDWKKHIAQLGNIANVLYDREFKLIQLILIFMNKIL